MAIEVHTMQEKSTSLSRIPYSHSSIHDQAQASHPWTPLDDEVIGFKLLHASFQTMMRRNVLSLETRTTRHDTTRLSRTPNGRCAYTHRANLALHSRGMQTSLCM